MTIFKFDNYKEFINKRILLMPNRGRGQYRKMANFLALNSVNVSQIFKGDRHLTLEQACDLSEFFGLSEVEADYLIALVEMERAGSHKLKVKIRKRITDLLERSQDLKQRLRQDVELTEET